MRKRTHRTQDFLILITAFLAAVGPAGSGGRQADGRETASKSADFAAAGPVRPLSAPVEAALAGISARVLDGHIRYLASPALAGRGLATPGLEEAVEYAAAALAGAGVPPLAASYFQTVPLRVFSGFSGRLTVERKTSSGTRRLALPAGLDCDFSQLAPRTVEAPLVFVSYGIREPELGRDDYAGLDVRGKIIVALAGAPEGDPWRSDDLMSRYASSDREERWEAKLETARELGAAALIGVEGDSMTAQDPDYKWSGAPFFLAGDEASDDGGIPLVRVSRTAADALLEAAGITSGSGAAPAPGPVSGVSITIRLTADERAASGRNVIGVIAGSDPKLREEAVVIGAHLDHLGIFKGELYPGADDNASGVAALIEIAKALAGLEIRPKRTVVFAFWTGEEEGKFGSGFYVRHPLRPLDRTVAYFNLDMLGHPWLQEEIRKLVAEAALPAGEAFLAGVEPEAFIEPGLPPGADDLEEALRRGARALGLALHFDRTDGVNGGSDYRDFARAGVPFIRFFGNFFPGYHEPGDTPDALDPIQVERMARFVFATAWLIADR